MLRARSAAGALRRPRPGTCACPRRALSHLSFDRVGSVISLTLASGKLNPLTEALLSDLEAAVDEIDAAREECRVVVVRGRGGSLTAGGHMTMLQHLPPVVPGHVDPVYTLFRRFGAVFDRLSDLPQAVVACVDGVAIGGGLGLLCASDVVLATARSRFGLPEVRAGFIPAQPLPFVVRRIGLSHATRLAVTGTLVTAGEALRMGLVHVICDGPTELDAALDAQLGALGRAEPTAVATVKEVMRRIGGRPSAETAALLDECTDLFTASLRSSPARDGVDCFVRKVSPPWARTPLAVPDSRADDD